jgi:uncharacterized protein (DUF1330 family)
MGVFIYAQLKIHDQDRYGAYMEAATPMFIEHGVVIHAADTSPRFNNMPEADKVVLMEFRDMAHMGGFMSNPDYLEAAKDRDAGADIVSSVFERMEWPKT